VSGVALVTGGSRGLGREAARALTADGWAVAITGRDAAALDGAVAAGDAALALPGDVTDGAAVASWVRDTEQQLGPVDLVLANAGAFAAGGRLWETEPETWWRDVEVNLRGVQLTCHAALPGMVARGSGRIVVMGSGIGMGPGPGGSSYAVSKAAVARLVESVAAELAGTGVTILTISPGMVETDMTRGFPAGFLAVHPELADPDPSVWTPPQLFLELLRRITAGEVDALHGRFVHARTDLDQALAAADDADRGTLRLVGW
jgi:NAD(P)-dependent dehydrogenase (short-subunit alcohol dehydrogenase family)